MALGGGLLAIAACEFGSGLCLRLSRYVLFAWTGAIGATFLALGWIGLPLLYGQSPINLLTLLLVLFAGKLWQMSVALFGLEGKVTRS